MILAFLVLTVLALAFANGANDNFKGVATLHGSGRLAYRPALTLATVTTLAGSLSAAVLATGLARRFGGQGLVPEAAASHPGFALAVALGAAGTVLLATRTGFPVSTTHALTGSLVGAGLVVAGSAGISWTALTASFLVPLLFSPLAAFALAAFLRPLLRRMETWPGSSQDSCLCEEPALAPAAVTPAGVLTRAPATTPGLRLGRAAACEREGARSLLTIAPAALVDGLHVASAGAVGFARGLNDAPKIAGLLVVAQLPTAAPGVGILALAMALGALLGARRVARTVAFGITGMSAMDGLGANLVTAGLVTLASPLGLPVSTTHVACGSLFGIGAANGQARWKMIGAIAAAWALTLPVGAALAAAAAAALHGIH